MTRRLDGALLPLSDYPTRARIERQILHLHSLGARAVAEFLAELSKRHRSIDADVRAMLGAYARLDRAMVLALGGDRFAPPPIRAAGGEIGR